MSHTNSRIHHLPSPTLLLLGVWALAGVFLGLYVWLTYSSIHLAAQRASWENQREIIASETAQLEEQYLTFESGAVSESARKLGLADAQERIHFVERRNTLAQLAASLSR